MADNFRSMAMSVNVDTKGAIASLKGLDKVLASTAKQMQTITAQMAALNKGFKKMRSSGSFGAMLGMQGLGNLEKGMRKKGLTPAQQTRLYASHATLTGKILANQNAVHSTERAHLATKRAKISLDKSNNTVLREQLRIQGQISAASAGAPRTNVRNVTNFNNQQYNRAARAPLKGSSFRATSVNGTPTSPRAASGFGGRMGGGLGIGSVPFYALQAGFAVGMAGRQASQLEEGAIKASFAAQGNKFGATGFQKQIKATSRQLHMSVGDSAEFTRQVQQLGFKDPNRASSLARGAGTFSLVNQEVNAADSAESFFRLFKSVSRAPGDFEALTDKTMNYASAVQVAGDMTAAGAADVFTMMQNMQQLGQFVDLGADGVIALSAALADLNPKQMEMFRTAALRLFTKGFRENKDNFASFLGISVEEFETMRKTEPVKLLQAVRSKVGTLSTAERADLTTTLGLSNTRDALLLGTLAGGKFDEILGAVRAEIAATDTVLQDMASTLKNTLGGSFKDVMSQMSNLGAGMVMSLEVPLKGILKTFSGLAEAFEKSPALRAVLAGAAFTSVVAFMRTAGIGASVGAFRRNFGRVGSGAAGAIGNVMPRTRGQAAFDMATLAMLGMPLGTTKRILGGGLKAGLVASKGRAGLARRGVAHMGAGKAGQRMAGALGRVGLGRVAGGLMARGGTAALLGGPVGAVLAGVSMLEPVFRKLGGLFDELGDKGGFLGLTLEIIGAGFKGIAAVGRGINKIFEGMGKLLSPLWDWINKISEKLRVGLFGVGARTVAPVAPQVNLNATMFGDAAFQDMYQGAAQGSSFGFGSTSSTG